MSYYEPGNPAVNWTDRLLPSQSLCSSGGGGGEGLAINIEANEHWNEYQGRQALGRPLRREVREGPAQGREKTVNRGLEEERG